MLKISTTMGKIIRSQLYLRKHLVTSSSSCKDTITNSDFRNSLHIARFQRHGFVTCKAGRGRNSRNWTRSYLWFRCSTYWCHICHDLLPKAVVLTCTTGTRSECENSRDCTRTVCSRISRCSDRFPCRIKNMISNQSGDQRRIAARRQSVLRWLVQFNNNLLPWIFLFVYVVITKVNK